MRSEESGSWLTTALMMFGLAVLCCLGFILTIGGCTSDVCSRTSDCATGLVCSIDSKCVVPPIDAAATTDGSGAGSADAATPDASIDAAIAGSR